VAEPLNATFFAFRRRERGGVLLGTSLAFLAAAIVLVAIFAVLFWSSLAPVLLWYAQIIEASLTNDTAAIEAAGFPTEFFGVVGGLLLWLFPFYILCAAYEAACLRWMIHGESVGLMGLSLGAPTWRVWSVYWIWFLLNLAFSIVISIVMAVVVGTIVISSGGDPTAAQSVQPVIFVVQYALMAYFGVRLAPAAATTIARRKFSFFHAWTVTKGRFVSLFGSFALIYLLYVIASLALTTAALYLLLPDQIPLIMSIISDPSQAAGAIGEVLGAYLRVLAQPQSWFILGALQLAGAAVAMLFYVASFGINARAAQAALEEGKIQPG